MEGGGGGGGGGGALRASMIMITDSMVIFVDPLKEFPSLKWKSVDSLLLTNPV